MSVDFNTNMASVAGVANPESTVEELVRSFFPNLDQRDHDWMCYICSRLPAENRQTKLTQTQQLMPLEINAGDIRTIAWPLVNKEFEKETVTQAKRLIREGLTAAEIIELINNINRIWSGLREVIVTQALRVITPQMKGKDIVDILSILQTILHAEQIPIVTQLTLSVGRANMHPQEIKEILQTLIAIPQYELHYVVFYAAHLITESASGQEICEILKAMQKIHSDIRRFVIIQFRQLNTQEMSGKKKGEILLALGAVPLERLELIGARVANHLTSDTKISLLFMSVRTEELFPPLAAGLSAEEIPKMLGKMDDSLNPAEIEKICGHSLPLISEKMSLKTRISIMKWVATHIRRLPPLSPVPPNVRFRSQTNPSSPSLLLGDLPRDLRWRLTIDRKDQGAGSGPNCFDQPPHTSAGYRNGMEGGLELIDHICGLRMNHQLLELLHDVSVDEVFYRNDKMKKGYDTDWYYTYNIQEIAAESRDQLALENRAEQLIFTPEMENEIIKRNSNLTESQRINKIIEAQTPYLAQSSTPDHSGRVSISSSFALGEENRITEILDRFYEEAAAAQTMDGKYAAVARCCRALIVFHPFPDGNGRTISFNLLTILLHQIGSPPCLQMRPPYFFNGTKTIREMVEFIKEGVEYFQRKKIEVLIGEYADKTPADKDAEDYEGLRDFYQLLDPCFTSERK